MKVEMLVSQLSMTFRAMLCHVKLQLLVKSLQALGKAPK